MDPKEPVEVGGYFDDIEGTILRTRMMDQRQRKSGWTGEECSVGLLRKGEGSPFVPILSLPFLQNDVYLYKFTGGKIVITTKKRGTNVVELNLEGISPNTITLPAAGPDKNIIDLDHDGWDKGIAPPSTWKDSDGPIEIRFLFEPELSGTTLTLLQAFFSQKQTGKSAHRCMIGYKRKGGGRSTFTPVLSLPHLESDEYEVKFTSGKIVVTTKRKGISVAELNLENLAPTTITQIQGEPDSGANRHGTTIPKSDSMPAAGAP